MGVHRYNEHAWDARVRKGNRWTKPVTPDVIATAREGEFSIVLTPQKPVPRDWFPSLPGCRVLGLACGGGQQAPILAAAGAAVTVFDASDKQLAQDRLVAERDGLELETVQGDMRDLSAFSDETFDLVFHPCSNSFAPDVEPVWREAFRVLRPGGTLLAGMCNPVIFIFDYEKYTARELVVRHSIPYSDLDSLSPEERQRFVDAEEPLCFGHSLESLLGGQTKAGFHVIGFYDDYWGDCDEDLLDDIMPGFFATRALRPRD